MSSLLKLDLTPPTPPHTHHEAREEVLTDTVAKPKVILPVLQLGVTRGCFREGSWPLPAIPVFSGETTAHNKS